MLDQSALRQPLGLSSNANRAARGDRKKEKTKKKDDQDLAAGLALWASGCVMALKCA